MQGEYESCGRCERSIKSSREEGEGQECSAARIGALVFPKGLVRPPALNTNHSSPLLLRVAA